MVRGSLLSWLDTAVSNRYRPVRSLAARGGAKAGGLFTGTDSGRLSRALTKWVALMPAPAQRGGTLRTFGCTGRCAFRWAPTESAELTREQRPPADARVFRDVPRPALPAGIGWPVWGVASVVLPALVGGGGCWVFRDGGNSIWDIGSAPGELFLVRAAASDFGGPAPEAGRQDRVGDRSSDAP